MITILQFVFPMVVAPRYVPGTRDADIADVSKHPKPQVPDASKITPPLTPQGGAQVMTSLLKARSTRASLADLKSAPTRSRSKNKRVERARAFEDRNPE